MKVYIGGYPNWLGPYQLAELTTKLGVSKQKAEKWGEWLSNTKFGDLLQWLHEKKKRTVYVKIDRYDTWAMDHTLSLLILPMLKQLKATQHGSPNVDDEDVPKALQSMSCLPKQNSWDIDDNHFKRWDWVMDEMIWAFTQMVDDKSTDKFYDHSEVDKKAGLEEQMGKIKIDYAGIEAHEARMKKAFMLFGKYYRGLWD
jgi:hypothetical protein